MGHNGFKWRLAVVLAGAMMALWPSVSLADSATSAPTNDSGATAWMLMSTALVLLMMPGLALFYGGLVRTKNVIGTMMHSFAAMAVVGVLWVVCGYSMAFGSNVFGGWFGWNSGYFLLSGIDQTIMSSSVPEYVFAMFQGKFAIITPALLAGAIAERVRFRGYCIFIALWSLCVYNPLCHWVWAGDGFLFKMGAIDYAGGTVVHISSGISGLVAALYLGARRGYPATAMKPSNLTLTLLGAALLWVGWFGFNAGSSIASGLDTARALTVTQVAAAAGALTWIIIEAVHLKKATSLGMASGILAGLVAITPAAGVVQPGGAIVLGVAAACASYTAIVLKGKLGYDDSLDAFGVHGVSGVVGSLLLVAVLRPSWTSAQAEGWTAGHQLMVQLTGVGSTIAYSVVATLILVVLVDKIVGLRMTEATEKAGMDHSLHGEQAYGLMHAS